MKKRAQIIRYTDNGRIYGVHLRVFGLLLAVERRPLKH